MSDAPAVPTPIVEGGLRSAPPWHYGHRVANERMARAPGHLHAALRQAAPRVP